MRGADHDAVLIDPDGVGDVDELIEIGNGVATIDQRRVRGMGAFDEGARGIGAAGIERDGDDGEAVVLQFLG
jgi:hypothetical protein